MFTAPTFTTRILLAICCATQLVVWSGCSRMMSPPGQRLFGQNAPAEPDQYDWNSPPSDASSMQSNAMQSNAMQSNAMQNNSMQGGKSNLGDQNAIPHSPQEALQAQYVQSYQVPQPVPPRLIPIESVAFPGDGAAEVVAASATMVDQPSTREALAVGFSDYSTETPTDDKAVTQAALIRGEAVGAAKPAAPALPAQTKIDLPPSQPQSKDQTKEQTKEQTVAIPPAKAVAKSNETKPSYDRIAESKDISANTFKPDEFQAARRSNKSDALQSSPSDAKTPKPEVATAKKSPPTSVSPIADPNVNPSKLAETKPAVATAQPEAPANGTMKMVLPNLTDKPESKPAKPVASDVAQTAANQTAASQTNKVKTVEPAGEPTLKAAGIKVDKNAFEISVPDKKKTESWKPKSEAIPSKTIPQTQTKPQSKADPTFTSSANVPLALNAKPVHPQPQISTNDAKTCAAPTKSTNDFCGTLPPKPDELTALAQPSPSTKSNPTIQKDGLASKPNTPLAQINSQFVPSKPAGPNAVTQLKIDVPATPGFSPTNSVAPSKPSVVTNLPPAKSRVEQPINQLPKPGTVAKQKASLSELGLLDRNFPATASSTKVPELPRQPSRQPISTSVKAVPNQFAPQPPQGAQLVSHLEPTTNSSALKLVNSQFCTEIKGFGQIKPFQSTRFSSNQRTLVYCEVENYNSLSRANGSDTEFVTRFRGRYQILDSKGNVAQSGQFPEIEDITVRKRRDFYLYFPITLKNLQPSNYELRLIIEESTPKSTGNETAIRVAEQKIGFSVD